LTAPTILVIDNELDTRQLIAVLLQRKLGAKVLHAADGREGLEIALAKRPDLIVLDMMMPEMNGWETAECLKARPETASIPILALTVAVTLSSQHLALKAGCDAFMPKPFSSAKLIGVIKFLLSGPDHVKDET